MCHRKAKISLDCKKACLDGVCSLWLDLLGCWGLPSARVLLPLLGLPVLLGGPASVFGARGPEQKPVCPAGLEHAMFLVHLH